jgi:hypothetical protein
MRIIADTHVHLYPCHEPGAALAGLATRLARLDPGAQRVGFLTERRECHLFADLAAGRVPLPCAWRSPQPNSMVLSCDANGSLFLFAGRQWVTAERIEILALTTDTPLPEHRPARDMVAAILAEGAIPVVSWAPGKWFFARGRTVRELIDTFGARLLLGDTTLRPGIWPEPRLMSEGRAAGLGILAGSDALPTAGEDRLLGTYASRLEGDFDPAQPVTSIRRLLLTPGAAAARMGRRGDVFEVIRRLRSLRAGGNAP